MPSDNSLDGSVWKERGSGQVLFFCCHGGDSCGLILEDGFPEGIRSVRFRGFELFLSRMRRLLLPLEGNPESSWSTHSSPGGFPSGDDHEHTNGE